MPRSYSQTRARERTFSQKPSINVGGWEVDPSSFNKDRDPLPTPPPRPSKLFPEHPPDVVNSIIRQLKRRGFFAPRQFVAQYPLELILEAMNDVDAMVEEGIMVRNPAGLIRWRVERTYHED